MNSLEILQSIYLAGRMSFPEESRKWTLLVHRLGRNGGAHAISVNSLGYLDVTLRQLEKDNIQEVAKPAPQLVFASTIFVSLSDSWLLSAYEIVRAVKATNQTDPRIKQLADKLSLARMPIAKAEIQGADAYRKRNKELPNLIMETRDDVSPNAEPRAYAHDGSYIVPRSVSTLTGSVVWSPFDLNTRETKEISRLEISNEFLNLLD